MASSRFDLTGRVALVSGAASGLGRATALALAEHGADLVLADINEAGMLETAQGISVQGRRVLPVDCNVSEPHKIRALFEKLDKDFGRIDFLANIAGEGLLGKPEE